MTYREVSEHYGVPSATIRKRASLEHWPTPTAIQRRIEAYRAKQAQLADKRQEEHGKEREEPLVNASQLSQGIDSRSVIADSWADRGEIHRALAFQMAHEGLKRAAQKCPVPKDWQEIDRADKMARRAAGLEGNELP